MDFLDRVKILEQVAILEEPFPPEVRVDVSDLPVRLAADESLHDISEVNERADLGYKAMAIKPAGKTLSKSMQMVQAAQGRGIPCFVADSACLPLLLEWNKNVASRLKPFPGLEMGIIESHGEQTYRNWRGLIADLPLSRGGWVEPKEWDLRLDEEFYQTSGGIFLSAGALPEVNRREIVRLIQAVGAMVRMSGHPADDPFRASAARPRCKTRKN